MGKSYKLAVASFIFLILGTSGLFAQKTGTLSGIVRDNTGNPIPGAAVMNKDSGKRNHHSRRRHIRHQHTARLSHSGILSRI